MMISCFMRTDIVSCKWLSNDTCCLSYPKLYFSHDSHWGDFQELHSILVTIIHSAWITKFLYQAVEAGFYALPRGRPLASKLVKPCDSISAIVFACVNAVTFAAKSFMIPIFPTRFLAIHSSFQFIYNKTINFDLQKIEPALFENPHTNIMPFYMPCHLGYS